ncbi:MAG: biotin/lipoyl-containing protein [Pseudomonadota bacterium]
MPTYQLIAQVDKEPGEEGSFLVRSPAVGVANGVPGIGVYLNSNEKFLTLRILNRRYTVQLPRDIHGQVTELFIEDTSTPLGYGQPLFRLNEAEGPLVKKINPIVGVKASRDKTEQDLIPILAPSDGVFYRKPAQDSPPYVEEGGFVTTGTVLGLVEVMKSFNQITYGGPDMPDRGNVAKILVNDASEVTFGQTLFLVRPE